MDRKEEKHNICKALCAFGINLLMPIFIEISGISAKLYPTIN